MSENGKSFRVAVLFKSQERYVFRWRDGEEDIVASEVNRMAADPELSFSYVDAAHIHGRLKMSKGEIPWGS